MEATLKSEISAKLFLITQGKGHAYVVARSAWSAIAEADLRTMGTPVAKNLGKVEVSISGPRVSTRSNTSSKKKPYYLICKPVGVRASYWFNDRDEVTLKELKEKGVVTSESILNRHLFEYTNEIYDLFGLLD